MRDRLKDDSEAGYHSEQTFKRAPPDCWENRSVMADHGAEGGALKGLRLITIKRGPEGYGFHMYTNRKLNVSVCVCVCVCSR